MMHGKGTFIWADGSSFYGEFLNDLKTGKGIMSWPDGRRVEGVWKNDKQSGLMKMTSANGVVYFEEYKNGYKVVK